MGDNDKKQQLYSYYQEYARAVRQLADAFWNLEEIWTICENLEADTNYLTNVDAQFHSYPFAKSFDELCYDVEAFNDEVQDWVDNIAPDELGI